MSSDRFEVREMPCSQVPVGSMIIGGSGTMKVKKSLPPRCLPVGRLFSMEGSFGLDSWHTAPRANASPSCELINRHGLRPVLVFSHPTQTGVNEMTKRYALRTTSIADCSTMWSTGGYWTSGVPDVADLMTGPQVDEFAKRHPDAKVIDVIVHRAACGVWMQAFRASIAALGGRQSTHEEREAARRLGDAAVARAGYSLGLETA